MSGLFIEHDLGYLDEELGEYPNWEKFYAYLAKNTKKGDRISVFCAAGYNRSRLTVSELKKVNETRVRKLSIMSAPSIKRTGDSPNSVGSLITRIVKRKFEKRDVFVLLVNTYNGLEIAGAIGIQSAAIVKGARVILAGLID